MIKYENKTNGRFYYLETQQDLLQDTVLVVHRGGKFQTVIRKVAKGDSQVIQKEIERIGRVRIRRGYELVNP